MRKTKVLIPTGYGLNCEREMSYSFGRLGAEVRRIHINDLLASPKTINEYHIIAFVGGFSDGDHVAAGKIQANRIRFGLGEELKEFVRNGKLAIGVCNGFQALVKAGVLPGSNPTEHVEQVQSVTLTYNDSGKFRDDWVHLGVNQNSSCVWTRDIKSLYLPIRHGEGKFVAQNGLLEELESNNQVVLYYINPRTGKPTMEYPDNPNGSIKAIAAICDPSGRVFGIMPHYEANLSPYNNPVWTRLKREGVLPDEGIGMQIPRNALKYVDENLLK
ncbi:MAG: phosphoribosylformylglycinamidine synthase subunit PurQ [Candidatus Micrarchaeota archaeon]|nr:phosphoribosylformylglycinamidine synthase subunit PurQ [Candidatus Micrarchaeota archaeon]MDE1847684.1 phosphoribosylformylglycinamidine synthase subunit PurQ [Candidatus Micrarchaeota archaeon]MDE1864505.1 phosphoribosylformylglycinamidine synthase subunit PurQ [Candidatus Micrarchaeota archaeon]